MKRLEQHAMALRRSPQVMLHVLVWLSLSGSLSYVAKNELTRAEWPGRRPAASAPQSHCLVLTLESLRDGDNDESIHRAIAFGRQIESRATRK